MKAIINSLNVNFNYEAIDNQYDFFTVTTTDKYILGGAYIFVCPVFKININIRSQFQAKIKFFKLKRNIGNVITVSTIFRKQGAFLYKLDRPNIDKLVSICSTKS